VCWIGQLTDVRRARDLELCRFKMPREKQLALHLPTWGGRRPGAGRRPTGERSSVSHARRPTLSRHHPVHVTWRMLPHVWNLRSRRAFRKLVAAFAAGCNRVGFRLIHFSVQCNHLHLIVEAADEVQLARGLQGLAVRIARGLNAMMDRKGKVFADRYHAHVLASPTEVARAVEYVLGNSVVHALRRGERMSATAPDECSSASASWTGPPLVAAPETWLLRVGWRRARAARSPLANAATPAATGAHRVAA
jgi:putative transposase